LILVTGATGTVGRTVVDLLVARGAQVRAATRSPATAHLPAGVDVARIDLGDPGTLPGALTGVDRVLLVSAGSAGPVHDANLATAAASAGVAHIVKLSALSAADDTAVDPITGWHRAGEAAVAASGPAWTFLRPTGFMSNAAMWSDTVRSHDTVYAPYGAGRTAVIDPRDIAAVAALVLTTPGHDGRAYPLTGPAALGPGDQVEILAAVLGRELRYVDVPPAVARRAMTDGGMPEDVADAVVALLATGLDPASAVVHPTVEELTGVPARSFRQWAQDHRGAF
jgi:uncharacterized protein YbjT (DUF2867 family)